MPENQAKRSSYVAANNKNITLTKTNSSASHTNTVKLTTRIPEAVSRQLCRELWGNGKN